MNIVQELFTPTVCAANSTTNAYVSGTVCAFGGFFCTTAGNFNLQNADGTDILPVSGVAIGQFVPGGLVCSNGMKVVLTGGAAGTLYHGPIG